MTSTVSFKDKFNHAFSIFKWDLKACSGIMTVYAILATVFTTVIFTLCAIIGSMEELPDDTFQYAIRVFQYISTFTVYALTMVFTIIYTVKVYSYLHNKRKADLYGSLPISRRSLFFSKSASAFLFSLIPALFFLGIISIVSIAFGEPLVNDVVNVYKELIIGSLACISAYGLISVCCGTTINAVIMFITTCVVYPISALFVKGVIGGFFFGSYSGIMNNHFIMNALNPLDAYNGRNIIYWIIFSVVCIIGSAFLIKNRKAERAQASFAYYLPCHIVKLLVAFIVGMFLGVLFGSLNEHSLIFFIFGFILGSIPAFVISHLIFYKGFSSLIKTSIPLGGLIIAVIAGMIFLSFDVMNYNEFVPKAEDVKSAGFIEVETSYHKSGTDFTKQVRDSATDFESKEDIENIVDIHDKYVDNLNISSQMKFQNVWVEIFFGSLPIDTTDAYDYTFAYKMNDGRTITRVYRPSTFIQNAGIPYIKMSYITSQKEYIEKYSAICNAQIDNIAYFTISSENNAIGMYEAEIINYEPATEQERKDTQKVIDALRKDFEADNDISDNFTTYSSESSDCVCVIKIDAANPSTNKDNAFTSLISADTYIYSDIEESIAIPESYTNTINALKEIGVLTDNNKFNKKSKYFHEYYYEEELY